MFSLEQVYLCMKLGGGVFNFGVCVEILINFRGQGVEDTVGTIQFEEYVIIFGGALGAATDFVKFPLRKGTQEIIADNLGLHRVSITSLALLRRCVLEGRLERSVNRAMQSSNWRNCKIND